MKPYLILYVVLAISCVISITSTNAFSGDLVEPIDNPFIENYTSQQLDFLTFGDWGFEGVAPGQTYGNQTLVAKAMETWAGSYNSDFIMNAGGK